MKRLENDEIPEKLKLSLKQLVDKDGYLLKTDLNERTICHKLAGYLEKYYYNLDVDVEYNKDIKEVKDLEKSEFVENLIDAYKKSEKDNQNNIEKLLEKEIEAGSRRRVLPDIIIHKRGEFERNNIVFEIKKSNNLQDIAVDKVKLQMYKDKLHYARAYFIVFKVDSDYDQYDIESNYCVSEIR